MNFACKHCGMATRFGKTGEAGKDSGLFLFEEAADGIDWIARVLLLLLRRSLGLRSAAETAQLRLQHASGDATHVGNKLGIGRGSLDLERERGATAATRILAITQEASGPTGCTRRSAAHFSEQATHGAANGIIGSARCGVPRSARSLANGIL